MPTIGGNISSNQGLITNGGYDQRPRDDTHAADNRLPLSERRDVLVFRTAPLEADLEVTGTVEVKLWVSSTAPDTDFTAKLIDEIPPNPDYPLGFDLNIGDSILRTRYREGLDHQAPPLEPGRHRADHDHALSRPRTSSRRGIASASTSRAAIIRGSTSTPTPATRWATTAGWSRPTTRSITSAAIRRRSILPVIPASRRIAVMISLGIGVAVSSGPARRPVAEAIDASRSHALPEDIGDAGAVVHGAGQDEQQVAQAVQVDDQRPGTSSPG